MSLSQAKILLEKIITLYKTMSNDEKNISPIERDLMLNYIRQLYETFLEIPVSNTAVTRPTPPPAPAPQPIAVPKVEIAPPPAIEEKPQPVFEAPKPPVVEPPQPQVEQPKIVVPPPPPPVQEPVVQQAPPPPPVQQPIAPPQPVFAASPTNTYSNISSEILTLFEDKTTKELSDKLANMPIADLTKALGFNDKLLTQNELFGGDKAAFDDILKTLNNASSFDNAKGLLIALASKYNWTSSEERKKQAQGFVKLVRRRFS